GLGWISVSTFLAFCSSSKSRNGSTKRLVPGREANFFSDSWVKLVQPMREVKVPSLFFRRTLCAFGPIGSPLTSSPLSSLKVSARAPAASPPLNDKIRIQKHGLRVIGFA